MPNIALLFGALLILLGGAGFVATGATQVTALIPAFFGVGILLSGAIAKVAPGARKHVMHVAALLGVIGTLGGLGMSVPKLLSGAELARPMATYLQLGLGILSLIFVVLCVKSFIDARRSGSLGG